MYKFNQITRMDLKQRLDFLKPEITEMVICIFEDAILIPFEHREVISDVKNIPID